MGVLQGDSASMVCDACLPSSSAFLPQEHRVGDRRHIGVTVTNGAHEVGRRRARVNVAGSLGIQGEKGYFREIQESTHRSVGVCVCVWVVALFIISSHDFQKLN